MEPANGTKQATSNQNNMNTNSHINLAAPNQQKRGFILRPSTHLENCNCDGSGPHSGPEVRRLPTGGDSAAILCLACYKREIAWRKSRNTDLEASARFDLPAWQSLEVCPTE